MYVCDLKDAYILVKKTITITRTVTDASARIVNERIRQVMFKNCAWFTDCKSETYDTSVENAEDLDVVRPMYNLIEYSEIYFKKSPNLWQYFEDNLINNITDSESFEFKATLTEALLVIL